MIFASPQMTESVPQRCHGEQSPFAHQPPVFREAWLRSLMSRDPRPNVLVQSPVMPVAAVAAELAGFCAHLQVCRVPGTLSLPEPSDRSLRTFLIGDVACLTPQQQFILWDWMNNRDRRIQVVSITSVPLLPLVEDGRFLDSLFYQLNIICVLTTE
jgi:transcriptional regulator of aromatic amino acid metabolism